MTNILDGLLARVPNKELRSAIESEVVRLRDLKDFGLVFERHVPENVRLYSHAVKRGVKVQTRHGGSPTTWMVRRIKDGHAQLVDIDGIEETLPIDELVVVREFGEPICTGLQEVESIEQSDDKPFHVVINSENHHALETLRYSCEGKVDCIYIDPPYNTGAKDWTYNNDFVDLGDSFRHSKWLSFMERRLKLARPLLKPDGVLIVTIDEHEVQNLGVLLRQTFKDARVQMVTIVTNTAGSTSPGLFSRSDEYAYFCFFGESAPVKMPSDLLAGSASSPQYWFPLHRSRGLNDRPSKRSNLVFPIIIDPNTLKIVGTGPSLQDRIDKGEKFGDLDKWLPKPGQKIKGNPVVWPILDTGECTTWQVNPQGLQKLIDKGYVRVRMPRGAPGPRPFTIAYIKSGTQKLVESGEIPVTGHEFDGAVKLGRGSDQGVIPKTTWKVPAHDARLYGTTMLRALLGNTDFTYPKSPYAVADTLRTVLADKPDALVLDFFAGSGTTLQSLAMLNREDEGRRRCILVTNNEVPERTRAFLYEQGHVSGDPECEEKGIAIAVTFPRIRATLTGVRGDGSAVPDEYLDGTPLSEGFEENAKFFELVYLDQNEVTRGKAFETVAPLLWLRAGASHEFIRQQKRTFAIPDGCNYAALFNVNDWKKFAEGLKARPDISLAFVFTDSLAQYQQVVAELPPTIECSMLYEDYLRNFEINLGSNR